MSTVRLLAGALKEGRAAAIARFTSDSITEAGKAEAATRKVDQGNDVNHATFEINGTFHILSDLNGRLPRWNHVNDSVPVMFRWEGDEAFHRLLPLVAQAKPGKGQSYLVISGRNSKAVREATFVGPLRAGDMEDLADLAQSLSRHPYDSISVDGIDAMLGSRNPWIVWGALARLQDNEMLRSAHFAKALNCRPGEEAEEVIEEMLLASKRDKALRASVSDCAFFEAAAPDKQKAALEYLLERFREPPNPGAKREIERYIDLPKLQETGRSYRDRIAGDAERTDIVPLIDAILQLK
jgi:hypothetical protein